MLKGFALPPMITTETIVQVCFKENCFEHFERRQQLDNMLENAQFSELETEFGCSMHDAVQLACEAIKFHSLRLDGHSMQSAVDRMVCPQFA